MARRDPTLDETPYSLGHCLGDLAARTCRFPVDMLRPGTTPRQRWIRQLVESAGRLSGYWRYWVLGRDPRPRLLTAGRATEAD